MTIDEGAAGAQQRQQRLRQPHLRVEVQRHRAPHVLPAALGERRVPRGAGVVDEQVEPAAVLALDGLAHARGRVVVGQVDGDDRGAADLLGQRPQPILAPRDQHEPRAGLGREPAGRRLADPAGRTGDDRDHAAEVCRLRTRGVRCYCARSARNACTADSGRPHVCVTSTRPLRTSRSARSPAIPASSSSLSAPCTAGTAAAWPKRWATRMRQCQSCLEYGCALHVTR